MELDKKKIVPVLEKEKFVKLSGNIYTKVIDGTKYGVDFAKHEIFRMDDLTRVAVDNDDETLAAVKKLCLDAMFPANENGGESSEVVPSHADQSLESEQTEEEEVTNEENVIVHDELVECEVIEPEELTTEEKLKVAEMVQDNGYDKETAVSIVKGTYKPMPVKGYSDNQINTIRNTVAKGANDDQLAMFLHLCNTYGLDPFLKEIFYSSELETIMTSRDGYLKIAQRDSNFKGMKSGVVHENDVFEMDIVNNTVKHTFGAKDRGAIVGAWAAVYHASREPVLYYAPLSEYDKGKNTWSKYKSAMIQKCAESPALKRQFGISGLVTQEEMGVEA